MWCKLLKINTLNSIYLNKNAYICNAVTAVLLWLQVLGTAESKNPDSLRYLGGCKMLLLRGSSLCEHRKGNEIFWIKSNF